jgi:dTDP-4-dehydrorhamnose reductase
VDGREWRNCSSICATFRTTGSVDLVHHDEFVKDIVHAVSTNNVVYKRVYTTNEDRYLAVLPKFNKLPKHLQITSIEVLKELKK